MLKHGTMLYKYQFYNLNMSKLFVFLCITSMTLTYATYQTLNQIQPIMPVYNILQAIHSI